MMKIVLSTNRYIPYAKVKIVKTNNLEHFIVILGGCVYIYSNLTDSKSSDQFNFLCH